MTNVYEMNSRGKSDLNEVRTDVPGKTTPSLITHTSTKSPSIWLSKRLLVVFMMFICYVNTAIIRFNISIAIVKMTYVETIETGNSTEIRPPEFDWDTKTNGLVLSIFYYGGLVTFMGGYVVTKLGGAVSCALSMMLSGFTTALHPISLHYGFYTFLGCRVLTGISESFLLVSISEVCSKWMPRSEKSKLMAFVVNGLNVGVAIVHSFCAFLANGWGWPMIFYATGAISMVTSIIVFIVVKNKPSEDKWISEKELQYIQQETTATSTRKVVHPYKSILTSGPVWAFLTTRFTLMWVFTILITCLPLYVKDVTGKSISKVGMISSLPNTVSIFIIPICGILLDYGKRLDISVTTLHKILISCPFLIGTVLFLVSVIISNFIVSIISFVLIQMMLSIVNLVSQIIAISLAPDSSGVIAGLGTFVFSLSSIMARSITGFMTTNHSLEEWNNCFILTGGISLFGAAMFVLCGSSEAQPWSLPAAEVKPGNRQDSDENQSEKV